MNRIIQAARFARVAHAGQIRKYNGHPYITHPARVAAMTALVEWPDGSVASEEMVMAAWLHDVVEDCNVPLFQIRGEFGHTVGDIVRELTNPSKDRKELSRGERKQLDRKHLKGCSREAKAIKLIDRIDNLREMAGADPDFVILYLSESKMLLECLRGAHEGLEMELASLLHFMGA